MSTLRKPCEHGKYDEHHYWMKVGYMDYRDVAPCPGGEFLTDDELIAVLGCCARGEMTHEDFRAWADQYLGTFA